jgi:hypothetical protein
VSEAPPEASLAGLSVEDVLADPGVRVPLMTGLRPWMERDGINAEARRLCEGLEARRVAAVRRPD